MLIGIWAPWPHKTLPDELVSVVERAAELGAEPGWIRFPQLGTRIQVFDRKRGRVCKMSKRDSAMIASIRTEIEVRSRIQELSPAIVKVARDGTAMLEDWVHGHRPPRTHEYETVAGALAALREHLYSVEHIDRNAYRELIVASGGLTDLTRHVQNVALAAFSQRLIPVSWVHGDLFPDNILLSREGTPLLIDWEYSGKRLASYDCWLYLYGRHRHKHYKRPGRGLDEPLPGQFFEDFAQLLRLLGCEFSPTDVSALHLLNLVERHAIMIRLGLDYSLMEADMNRAVMSKKCDSSAFADRYR